MDGENTLPYTIWTPTAGVSCGPADEGQEGRSQTNSRHLPKGMITLLIAWAVAGMLLVMTGCSSGSDEESAPTAAATPTMAATSIAAATPKPTQELPAATPAPAVEVDPSDAFFAMDRVLEIEIEIAPEDWDTLRHQTRTFEDVIAEIEEFQLSRPFSDIYTWFSGTVTVDGETHAEVGVRKKGFIGSQSDTKPALKLRFDKYVDGQSLSGGAKERMTLNNSVQDPSMINTCLAFHVFAAAGAPAPRCNFATVTVNGKNLGLYVHVEEIKAPFLARHFDSAEGNLYEGTVSDFTPQYRGTIEKKNNEDMGDWSDIDAVVAALQDPSEAGLEDLEAIVDLDRFLSFWATEALVGHWDGYAGNRNNYWFYREPGGKFVFIPWGVDDTFHLKDDPNVFDHITEPPSSVLALSAIANRLYNDAEWQEQYVGRLREILRAAWDEEELLALVDSMAAIVEERALPEARPTAAAEAERVRQFIRKRRAEILEDLTPEPPEWPDAPPEPPAPDGLGSGALEVRFETTWGSNESVNPLTEGEVVSMQIDGAELPAEDLAVVAGKASPDDQQLLPGVADLASLVIFTVEADGSVQGVTVVTPRKLLVDGASLVIGRDTVASVVWSVPAGGELSISLFYEGTLELSEAGYEDGAAISGSFSGAFGGPGGEYQDAAPSEDTANAGLVINEVAAKGDPLDWFELYNASDSHLALANFTVADDLDDPGKRVAFPAGLVIAPGEYLQVEVDKDAWPGFALGSDEELGVWTADGVLVDKVDWDEGQSGEGMSYARVPDVTGDFRGVANPTPGGMNQGDN